MQTFIITAFCVVLVFGVTQSIVAPKQCNYSKQHINDSTTIIICNNDTSDNRGLPKICS
jgi:hypothetical protein